MESSREILQKKKERKKSIIWSSNPMGIYPKKTIILKDIAAAAAKSPQSCRTLCNPIEGSPLGSSVPGILQARTLEWVSISFSNAWNWKVKVKSLRRAWLLATPWTGAHQAPPSMGFSRQECWSEVPLPSPNWSTVLCNYCYIAKWLSYTYVCIFFFIFFSIMVYHTDSECSYLCSTVEPCLSILCIPVCIC